VSERTLLVPREQSPAFVKNNKSERMLTLAAFHQLQDVPPLIEWLANIENEKTRQAYQQDVSEFCRFVGINDAHTEQFRQVTRAHVIAWREALKHPGRMPRPCGDATVRRKLASLSAFFKYLCDRNAVDENPVSGVKRPKISSSEGSTPAVGDEQIRRLLQAPPLNTLKGKCDRAILSTLAYHGLCEQELCRLRVRDYTRRAGVMQFTVHGKGDKIRYVPVHPATQEAIHIYLELAGHSHDLQGALFRPVRNNRSATGLAKPLSPTAIYTEIVMKYAKEIGITADTHGFCVHSMRVTFGTNAWEHGADIVDIQQTLGHANVATTRSYLRMRRENLADSPVFKAQY
jgi:integrase/recombinase XerD